MNGLVSIELKGLNLSQKFYVQAVVIPSIIEVLEPHIKNIAKLGAPIKEVELCSKECCMCAFEEVCNESDVLKGVH